MEESGVRFRVNHSRAKIMIASKTVERANASWTPSVQQLIMNKRRETNQMITPDINQMVEPFGNCASTKLLGDNIQFDYSNLGCADLNWEASHETETGTCSIPNILDKNQILTLVRNNTEIVQKNSFVVNR